MSFTKILNLRGTGELRKVDSLSLTQSAPDKRTKQQRELPSCMIIYRDLIFCCGFRLFHDATYEITTHVTVHGVGPIFGVEIIEGFIWQKLSVTKTTVITVGTVFEIRGLLHSDNVWIHLAAHAAFFD